jgi:hypothetical protein
VAVPIRAAMLGLHTKATPLPSPELRSECFLAMRGFAAALYKARAAEPRDADAGAVRFLLVVPGQIARCGAS